jgi:hypothetical protein
MAKAGKKNTSPKSLVIAQHSLLIVQVDTGLRASNAGIVVVHHWSLLTIISHVPFGEDQKGEAAAQLPSQGMQRPELAT